MQINKMFWSIRALLFNFVTTFKLPGYIGRPLYISSLKQIEFGKKVRIYPGLRAEVINSNGKIIFKDNISVGQNLHIISNDENLIIGNNVIISGNVFITNCDHSYEKLDTYIYDQPLVTKHTEIGDNTFIGYGAIIQAGTILGKNCIVGSNAVVRGNFPDNVVIVGVPAKIVKKYNKEKNVWEKV